MGIAQNPSLNLNLEQWSDADFLTLKNILQNCLPLIRYFLIPSKDVLEKVRPYRKILEPTLWKDILSSNCAINSIILPPRNILPKSLPLRNNPSISTSVQESIAKESDNMKEIELIKAKTLRKHIKHARRHYNARKSEDALVDLNKSLEIEPDNALALRYRGETYRLLNRLEEAMTDLNKSLEIEPNNAITLKFRGSTFLLMKRYEKALTDLNKSLEIEPNNLVALEIRGQIYIDSKRYEESLADLTQTLKIKPTSLFALSNRGNAYRMLNRFEEAITDLNKSLEIEPNDAWALSIRGDAYRKMHKYEKALADLTQALKIEPNSQFTLRTLEKLNKSTKKKH